MEWGLGEWFIANYLLGILLLIGIRLRACFQNRERFTGWNEDDKSFEDKVLLVAVVVVGPMAWPLLLWLLIEEYLNRGKNSVTEPSGPGFECRKEYLKKVVSVVEIESQHMIFDPLNKVPALPFGHLNSGWRKFVEAIQPDEEVWEFQISPGQPVGKWDEPAKGIRSGMARVNAHKIVGEFVFERD